MTGPVESAVAAARERWAEAQRTGRGVEAAAAALAAVEQAADVFTPPIEDVSLYPHRHARRPS